MNEIERLLDKEKEKMDNLLVPENMEDILRNKLNDTPNRKKKNNFKIKVASIILAFILLSYNADTLAFYGKKLIGYENVMNGTLRELNELGKGQIIDKSHTFSNGIKVSVDGIMLDDNNMVIFYTIYNPEGNVMDSNVHISLTRQGGRPHTYGGQGQSNEDETRVRWIISTSEVPKFFENTINFNAELSDLNERATIKIKIDRNQAVGKSIRIPINKKFELDQRKLEIESMTVSPMTTVLKGQIQNIVELGLDYINDDRFRPESVGFSLIADGVEIPVQGARISTDMKGINFSTTFESLPKDIKDLELRLTNFGGDHDVNEKFELKKGETTELNVLDQEISIEDIYESEGNTYIKFTTDEHTVLSRVYLNIDGVKIGLQKTISGDYEKIVDDNKAIIKYTRTIEFKGTGEELELEIQRIRFTKKYDKVVYSYHID